jgi:hypothetical protein
MAIFRGWSSVEIGTHFQKLFQVPEWHEVRLRKLGDDAYEWGISTFPTYAPAPVKTFAIIIGGHRIQLDMNDGPAGFLGECISRIAKVRLSPLERCEFISNPDGKRVTIKHDPKATSTKRHI